MCGGIVLGVLGGLAAAKLIAHRWRCGHGHGCGGWYPGHGGRWRGGWGHRGGGVRLFWLWRRLGLSREQRAQAYDIWQELRREGADLRAGGWRGIDAVLEALGSEQFDRDAVQATASEQLERLARTRERVVELLARFHALLTPEQRARLRAMMTGGPGGCEGGHPYRGECGSGHGPDVQTL